LLEQFKGQTVRLTAKVIKLSGDTATVEASDGGQVGLLPFQIPFQSLYPIVPLAGGDELIYRSDFIYREYVIDLLPLPP
jgi:hypothetical protein